MSVARPDRVGQVDVRSGVIACSTSQSPVAALTKCLSGPVSVANLNYNFLEKAKEQQSVQNLRPKKMDTRDTKSNSAHLENVPEESTQCETSPWKCLAQNPWVILFCLYGNLGALMYGFDNLVLSLALSMPAFE